MPQEQLWTEVVTLTQTLSGTYDEVDFANHLGWAEEERDLAWAERDAANDRHALVPPQTLLVLPHVLLGDCTSIMMWCML